MYQEPLKKVFKKKKGKETSSDLNACRKLQHNKVGITAEFGNIQKLMTLVRTVLSDDRSQR